MFKHQFRHILCTGLVCALGGSASAVEISLIPVGGTGGTGSVDPGSVIIVEVWISGWSPDNLVGVQTELAPASLTSATSGSLSLFNSDANEDGICDMLSASYCPTCAGQIARDRFDGIFVDDCRPDHFAAPIPWVSAVDIPGLRLASTALGGGAADPGEPRYVGTYVFQVSPDARGTFTLVLFPKDDPNSVGGGSWATGPGTPAALLPNTLIPATITVVEGRCCRDQLACEDTLTRPECDALNGIWTADLTCATPCQCLTQSDCSDNDPCTRDLCGNDGTCTNSGCHHADISPCDGGDGFVDLDDILLVLEAFSGNHLCPDVCCTP